MQHTHREIHWCLTCQLSDCNDACPMHRRNTHSAKRQQQTTEYHAQYLVAEREHRLSRAVQAVQRASLSHG